MNDHLIRMTEELKELDDKISKLNSFINREDSIYHKLEVQDQDLLLAQLNAMYTYSVVLKIRLDKGIKR